MKPERTAGLALIVGTLVVLVTVFGHPHGGQDGGHMEWSNPVVLGLSIVSLGVLLFGFARLARLAGPHNAWVDAALVAFAIAGGTGAMAPVMNHAVSPGLVAHAAEYGVTAPADSDGFKIVKANNSLVNRTLFQICMAAWGTATIFLAAAMFVSDSGWKALAAAGVVVGLVTTLGVASGHLTNSLHHMMVVLAGLGAWLIALGVGLCLDRVTVAVNR